MIITTQIWRNIQYNWGNSSSLPSSAFWIWTVPDFVGWVFIVCGREYDEVTPFCSYTSKMGQWMEGVHKDQFPGHGVEEGSSGVKECALSDQWDAPNELYNN